MPRGSSIDLRLCWKSKKGKIILTGPGLCTVAQRNDIKRSLLTTYACRTQSVHVEQGKESPWGVQLGAQCLLRASIID